MTGRWSRLRYATLLAAVALATAACGGGDEPATATDPTPPASETAPTDLPTYEWGDDPSPVVLLLPEEQIELTPWTSCWSGPPDEEGVAAARCADGAPGLLGEIPGVGSRHAVDFWFGMPGWTFEAAFFRSEGETAEPRGEPLVERTGKQTFRVTGIDEPGTYRVDLSGRGEQGDVHVSFRWTIAG